MPPTRFQATSLLSMSVLLLHPSATEGLLYGPARQFSAPTVQQHEIGSSETTTSRRTILRTAPKPPPRMRRLEPVRASSLESAASTAAVAAAAVSKAVSMRTLEAPDVGKSFVALDTNGTSEVDEAGLPLVYNKEQIETYWRKEGNALQQRWSEFLRLSVPFLTRMATMMVRGGVDELSKNDAKLARDARQIMEELGPTYIKVGQMMSVRPDVLPQAALDELAVLQDAVVPFSTEVAIECIEAELGVPLGAVFSEISQEPVAAASLAQVYKARLNATGEEVAVKVQRPAVLETVSKDLYVLRRAAEVYQGLIDRFAPQQRTDYVALLNEWAVGFYTELDFLNEARNQATMKRDLANAGVTGVHIPKVHEKYCTRRLVVTEWVDGVKLSQCEPEEIRELIQVGQEVFLTQLLQTGVFHSDPHPGNMMKLKDPTKHNASLCLIDFGLVARLQQQDMDTIVSAVIHLANKDYRSLVDDFIDLGILPPDCDRAKVIPLMDKALSPYVKGGGATKYVAELEKTYGFEEQGSVSGFQAMTNDLLTVLNDIPFTIPPYFALIARAVVILEGVALTGDPDYGLITEAYPFVARKLLREDRPALQQALQEVLYGANTGHAQMSVDRLAAILNGAMGAVARTDGGSFVDLDSVPDVGAAEPLELAQYLLSDEAAGLRRVLEPEVETAADILLRQALRKSGTLALAALPRPRLPFVNTPIGPDPENVPGPVVLPPLTVVAQPTVADGTPPFDPATSFEADTSAAWTRLAFVTPRELLDAVAPPLTREEELYALSLTDLAASVVGEDAAVVARGDVLTDPDSLARVLLAGIPAVAQSINGQPSPVGTPGDSTELPAAALTGLSSLVEAAGPLLPARFRPLPGSDTQRSIEQLQSVADGLSPANREVATDVSTRLGASLLRSLEKRLAGLNPQR